MNLRLRRVLIVCTSVLLAFVIAAASIAAYFTWDAAKLIKKKNPQGGSSTTQNVDFEELKRLFMEKLNSHGELMRNIGYDEGYAAGLMVNDGTNGADNTVVSKEISFESKDEADESPFNAETLFNRVKSAIVKAQTKETISSAINIKDEQMENKSITYYVPGYGNFALEDTVVAGLADKFNMTVVTKHVRNGINYNLDVRNAVNAGKAVDLFSVKPEDWGTLHTYAQDITDLVDFDLMAKQDAEMQLDENAPSEVPENKYRSKLLRSYMNAFRIRGESSFKHNMNNASAIEYVNRREAKDDRYYAVAGVGAPYILAYNKAMIREYNAAQTDENQKLPDPAELYWRNNLYEITATTEQSPTEPVVIESGEYPYVDWDQRVGATKANANWTFKTESAGEGVFAFKDIIEALTDVSKNQFGLAWPDNGIYKSVTSGSIAEPPIDIYPYFGSPYSFLDVYRDGGANKGMAAYFELKYPADQSAAPIQFITEENRKANIAKFTTAQVDNIKSPNAAAIKASPDAKNAKYAFWHADASELPAIAANNNKDDWDFVPYPSLLDGNGSEFSKDLNYKTSPGWVVGFAVGKNSSKAAISLRFAEELSSVWNNLYEEPIRKSLTNKQWKRYQQMKQMMSAHTFEAMEKSIMMNDSIDDDVKANVDFDKVWYNYDYCTELQIKNQVFNKDTNKFETISVDLTIDSQIKSQFLAFEALNKYYNDIDF